MNFGFIWYPKVIFVELNCVSNLSFRVWFLFNVSTIISVSSGDEKFVRSLVTMNTTGV